MKGDLIELNSINAAAIGITFVDVHAVLTTLVLITALIYNVQRLMKWSILARANLSVMVMFVMT